MQLLQEACIDEGDYQIQDLTVAEVHHNTCNLLKDLVNVKKLHIHASLLQSLLREDLIRRYLPILTYLTYLQVFYPCHGCDILSVLQIMPNLEYLTFDRAYTTGEGELTPYSGEMFPQCFRSRIKENNINEYNESNEDSHIIIFLLRNVPALKITSVTNFRDDWGDPGKIIRMRRNFVNS